MTTSHTQSGHHEPHAVPVKVLLCVFAALMLLTFITVAVTQIDLGAMNIWLAMLIAVVKAGLVAMYFMHLRYDSPFNGIVLISALFFVAIFIGIALLDTQHYQPDFEPPANATAKP